MWLTAETVCYSYRFDVALCAAMARPIGTRFLCKRPLRRRGAAGRVDGGAFPFSSLSLFFFCFFYYVSSLSLLRCEPTISRKCEKLLISSPQFFP